MTGVCVGLVHRLAKGVQRTVAKAQEPPHSGAQDPKSRLQLAAGLEGGKPQAGLTLVREPRSGFRVGVELLRWVPMRDIRRIASRSITTDKRTIWSAKATVTSQSIFDFAQRQRYMWLGVACAKTFRFRSTQLAGCHEFPPGTLRKNSCCALSFKLASSVPLEVRFQRTTFTSEDAWTSMKSLSVRVG